MGWHSRFLSPSKKCMSGRGGSSVASRRCNKTKSRSSTFVFVVGIEEEQHAKVVNKLCGAFEMLSSTTRSKYDVVEERTSTKSTTMRSDSAPLRDQDGTPKGGTPIQADGRHSPQRAHEQHVTDDTVTRAPDVNHTEVAMAAEEKRPGSTSQLGATQNPGGRCPSATTPTGHESHPAAACDETRR